MNRNDEMRLFEQLAGNRPLLEWVRHQLAVQVDVLVHNTDHDNVLRAQGAAALLKRIEARLVSPQQQK